MDIKMKQNIINIHTSSILMLYESIFKINYLDLFVFQSSLYFQLLIMTVLSIMQICFFIEISNYCFNRHMHTITVVYFNKVKPQHNTIYSKIIILISCSFSLKFYSNITVFPFPHYDEATLSCITQHLFIIVNRINHPNTKNCYWFFLLFSTYKKKFTRFCCSDE